MDTTSETMNQFLNIVHKWFIEQGEVFFRVELFPMAGYTDYYLYADYEQFVEDFKKFPYYYNEQFKELFKPNPPTIITTVVGIKNTYFPIRGIIDDNFFEKTKQVFKEGEEFIFLLCTRLNVFLLSGLSTVETEVELIDFLEEHKGELCIFGKEPDYHLPLKEDIEIEINLSYPK